jgi:dephospho-CoA kinase
VTRFVVGLTGGIGSGKSAAAAEFARRGVSVVDADAIAHELTRAGGAAVEPIRAQFGSDYVDAGGALDRARMRALVFADPAARKRLEALLHPMIRAEAETRIGVAAGRYVIHVVPLLVESPGYRARVDRVLVVDCPESVQIERVQRRSGLSAQAVQAIVHSQVSRAERLVAADDVIDNSGTIDALHKQIAALHQKYLELAQSRKGSL